jgi:hypothetical protein
MSDLEKDNVDYGYKINRLSVIENCVLIICLTVLAVVFNRWWIVFFSALFFSKVESKDKKGD